MIRHGSKVADTNVVKLSSARRMSIWDQIQSTDDTRARVLARELPLKEQLQASVERKARMNEAAIARVTPAEMVLTVPEDKMQILGDVIAPGLSKEQLEVFALACNRTRLDPFAKQICAVIRWDSELQRNKMTVQTTIDGFRVIAERTGKYAGRKPFEWCGPDGVWVEVWLKKEPPAAARARVLRKDFPEPLAAIARYKAYVATKSGGAPTYMWTKMDAEQLAKCAEALALRTAFPQELGGLYTEDELEQAGMTEAGHVVPAPPARTVEAKVEQPKAPVANATPASAPPAQAKTAPPSSPAEPCFARSFPIKAWSGKPMRSADAETIRDYIAYCEGVLGDRNRSGLHKSARASMAQAEVVYGEIIAKEGAEVVPPDLEEKTTPMMDVDGLNQELDRVYDATRDDFPQSWRGQ